MGGIDLLREKVRKRNNYTCQCGLYDTRCIRHPYKPCGRVWGDLGEKERKFDVHHLIVEFENTNSYKIDKLQIEAMMTLCHYCHLNLPHIRKKFYDRK